MHLGKLHCVHCTQDDGVYMTHMTLCFCLGSCCCSTGRIRTAGAVRWWSPVDLNSLTAASMVLLCQSKSAGPDTARDAQLPNDRNGQQLYQQQQQSPAGTLAQPASHADCYEWNSGYLVLALCLQRPGTCRHGTRPRQLTDAHAHSGTGQGQQQLLPQSQALLAATVTAVSLLFSSPAAQAATAEANFGTKCVGELPGLQRHVIQSPDHHPLVT
jgi:hypothetical protein